MRPEEAIFREVAAVLDSSLSSARTKLENAGIEIVDVSATTYHYKNHYLSWGVRLVVSSPQPFEDIARVTVHLSYGEPGSPTEHNPIDMVTWAESFQIGQHSRFFDKKQVTIEREQLGNSDFAGMVLKEIEWGKLRIASQEPGHVTDS